MAATKKNPRTLCINQLEASWNKTWGQVLPSKSTRHSHQECLEWWSTGAQRNRHQPNTLTCTALLIKLAQKPAFCLCAFCVHCAATCNHMQSVFSILFNRSYCSLFLVIPNFLPGYHSKEACGRAGPSSKRRWESHRQLQSILRLNVFRKLDLYTVGLL